MKKVFIIAFHFPPDSNIGAQRPYRLAKYLPRHGWDPTVLTVLKAVSRPAGMRLICTHYRDVLASVKSGLGLNAGTGVHQQLNMEVSKNFVHSAWKSKAIRLVREIVAYPDEFVGWYRPALRAAAELMLKERFHAIISTSYPVTCHLIGRSLKQKFGVPWVADYRDLWTQNHYVRKTAPISFFEHRLELRTMADADVLVTANPQVEELRMLHPRRKILCITNGFDREDYPGAGPTLSKKFTITYTGILYNGKRDPSLLFQAVLDLIAQGSIERDSVEIRFFGREEPWLRDEIRKYGMEGIASMCGSLPREDVLEIQRSSQLLLLLLWDNRMEEKIYPGKVFEYLGAGRPVIAMGGSGGVVRDLLRRTGAGRFAGDLQSLRTILMDYYAEFRRHGQVLSGSNGTVEQYAYEGIAGRYSEVLEEISVG